MENVTEINRDLIGETLKYLIGRPQIELEPRTFGLELRAKSIHTRFGTHSINT